MKKSLKIILFYLMLFSSSRLNAQDIEMADGLRANGKIYVVVVVATIVISVILGYMITIDRKISKLEKKVNKDLQ